MNLTVWQLSDRDTKYVYSTEMADLYNFVQILFVKI